MQLRPSLFTDCTWLHVRGGVTVCFCLCSGPNRGHYITIVKSHGFWLLFDDDIVEVGHWASLLSLFGLVCCSVGVLTKPLSLPRLQKIDAQAIEEFYGLTSDISKNSESGYILFYQSREWWIRDTAVEATGKEAPSLFSSRPLISATCVPILLPHSVLPAVSLWSDSCPLGDLHLDRTLPQKQKCSSDPADRIFLKDPQSCRVRNGYLAVCVETFPPWRFLWSCPFASEVGDKHSVMKTAVGLF